MYSRLTFLFVTFPCACHVSHTDPPAPTTTTTTAASITASSATPGPVCQNWCASNGEEWKFKCDWENCGGCFECSGECHYCLGCCHDRNDRLFALLLPPGVCRCNHRGSQTRSLTRVVLFLCSQVNTPLLLPLLQNVKSFVIRILNRGR